MTRVVAASSSDTRNTNTNPTTFGTVVPILGGLFLLRSMSSPSCCHTLTSNTHTHTHADTKDISKSTFFLFWIPTIFRNNNGRDFFFLSPSTILDDNNWRKAVNWLGLVWSDIQSAETFCYSYVDIIIIQGMKWFLCVCDWQVHQKTGRIRPHRVGNGIQKPLALFVFRNQVLSCCQVSAFFLYAHTHRK